MASDELKIKDEYCIYLCFCVDVDAETWNYFLAGYWVKDDAQGELVMDV
jgi:hypothetical protein